GGEAYFAKLRSVFALFRGREDVVLWWRPHPNTELNFVTKRPALLGEYKKLVADYKRAGFGIYDDTADLHRAIVWTYAYYGDWSSLVIMCLVAGKPIMCLNINEIPDEINPSEESKSIGVFLKNPADMKTIRDCCHYESDMVRLSEFVDFAIGADVDDNGLSMKDRCIEAVQKENTNANGKAGQAIYDFVKKNTLG
ncbi:MAG: hypothetical protein LBE16_03595, partial [Clostridiales Family XIII bacterium]|nr:hypothetical protein [Clostridiales Family XIII bacterium]